MQQDQNILENQFLYDFLSWKYKEYPLLERFGKTYPVVIFPAAPAQINDPESALAVPLITTYRQENDFIIRDKTYRRLLEKAGKKIENRPSFTFRSLQVDNRVSLQCDLGYYHDALDTCYALEWELIEGLAKKPLTDFSERVFNDLSARLPLREKTHLYCSDPVKSGSGRSAFIGISVLICYRDGDDYYLLIQKRSDTAVTIDTSLFHVVPSFVFQPATVFLEQEYSIIHNLKREYLEELFDRPEPEKNEVNFRYFYSDKRLLFLENFINNNMAAIYLTGIAINLLNLRPEICLLLLIKSNEWYSYHSKNKLEQQRFHLNAEWATVTQQQGILSELTGRIPLNNSDESLCNKYGLDPGKIAPAGAAALWLGLDLLQQLGIRK